ncbi:MAG TPA: glucosyl-3-phosphoglycerate synthase [Candidatus Thermoplasmatota archaeon]|nr:glucosyl-3-phosphoglycerate synthase [Candidatus Thermoplasmatota archaeon]
MDFSQETLTTIHALNPRRGDHVRSLVKEAVADRPAALVLPMLYSEMERPALSGIRDALKGVDYLNEIVVPLTAKDEDEYRRVVDFFSVLKTPTTVVWCESPSVQEALKGLEGDGIHLDGLAGKGLAVWIGGGVASLNNYAIAMHDADIEEYDPDILAHLLFPIVRKEMDFYFSKGYYARLSDDRLYGRAVRLFLWPFLDALQVVTGHHSQTLRYFRSFRYPLSGEMALTTDLFVNMRMPTDWGLELGLLGEVYRNASMKRISQVDLGFYSHKHKTVGSNPNEGLQRMVGDLTTTILRVLTENEGTQITEGTLTSLRVTYRRHAQDHIRKYFADALANGLAYDRHTEEAAIDAFARVITEAGRNYLASPGREQIPDWLRCLSADPKLPNKLLPPTKAPRKRRSAVREAALQDAENIV